ncbi:MAG: transcriptional repressor LexA [Planctomycetales bacterium]|nr:transcriptional repressor LexA [Planctomycetales bacterium]
MNRPLTGQQQAVYDFIRDKIVVRGYGPTVREIGEHMNIKSPNGVMSHLRALERKGVITRTANRSRSIELTEPLARVDASLPISGTIVNGWCYTAATAGQAAIDLARINSSERSALRVMDDALSAAAIQVGDLLVIQAQSFASPGQLALVQVGEMICLRHWHPEPGGRIRLSLGNRFEKESTLESVQVLGVAVGLIRSFGERLFARYP